MHKRKRLKQVFQKIFNTNLDYNKLSTKELENWDSVNHLMLIMSLEEEYNIKIPADDFQYLYSDFEKILEYLKKNDQ